MQQKPCPTCRFPAVSLPNQGDTLHWFLCMVLASWGFLGSVFPMTNTTADRDTTWKPVIFLDHLFTAMKEEGIEGISHLAREAKVHRNTLALVLNEQSCPSYKVVARIAKAVHRHPDYISGWQQQR